MALQVRVVGDFSNTCTAAAGSHQRQAAGRESSCRARAGREPPGVPGNAAAGPHNGGRDAGRQAGRQGYTAHLQVERAALSAGSQIPPNLERLPNINDAREACGRAR